MKAGRNVRPSLIILQKIPYSLTADRIAQFAQGFCLYLADTLSGNIELLANLFQRPWMTILQAKTQYDNLTFALF